MRILLLWEWLYHYDSSAQQAITKHGSQWLEDAMAKTHITGATLSKVKKLKFLIEKSQAVNELLNASTSKS